jgi:hypothetical protein
MSRSAREAVRDVGIVVVVLATIGILDALSDAARDVYNGQAALGGQ